MSIRSSFIAFSDFQIFKLLHFIFRVFLFLFYMKQAQLLISAPILLTFPYFRCIKVWLVLSRQFIFFLIFFLLFIIRKGLHLLSVICATSVIIGATLTYSSFISIHCTFIYLLQY